MKPESLLSRLSDLSHLSNVSYQAEKPEFTGSQFFKESNILALNPTAQLKPPKQE